MYMKDVVQICKQIKINPLSLISHHIDSEVCIFIEIQFNNE